MCQPGGVHSALGPVLGLAACLGVRAAAASGLRRALLLLYCGLLYAGLAGCVVLTLFVLQEKDPRWYASLIYLLIEKLQLGVGLGTYTAAVRTGLRREGALRAVVGELAALETELAAAGLRVRYSSRWVLAVACLRVLALGGVAGLDVLARPQAAPSYQLLYLLAFHGPLLSVAALQVENLAVLHYLGEQLTAVSRVLRGCGEPERVHAALRAYDRLCAAGLSAGAAFAGSVFCGLGAVFFAAVVCVHMLASARSYSLAASPALLAAFGAATLLARVLELWCIVYPYVSLTNKVRDFNAVLYNSIVLDKSGKLTQSEKIQCHIALKRDITFTAAGFFTIDFSLAHSMVGAVTTFVVILLQYDSGS